MREVSRGFTHTMSCDTSEMPNHKGDSLFQIGRVIKQRKGILKVCQGDLKISDREMFKIYRESLKFQIGRFSQK